MHFFDVPYTFDDAVAVMTSGTASAVTIVVYVLFVVASWRMFSKAGYLGILALIPIVNLICLVRISGRSGWLVLLYLIPVVNVIFAIFVALGIGKHFGKGAFFSVLWLWIFPIIGYFVIGFGDAQYRERV